MVELTPTKGLIENRYAIGIAMDEVAHIRMPFFTSIGNSFVSTLQMIRDTVVGLVGFVVGLFRGTSSISDVSGPVGIAVIIGNAFRLNISYLMIEVLLFLSIWASST